MELNKIRDAIFDCTIFLFLTTKKRGEKKFHTINHHHVIASAFLGNLEIISFHKKRRNRKERNLIKWRFIRLKLLINQKHIQLWNAYISIYQFSIHHHHQLQEEGEQNWWKLKLEKLFFISFFFPLYQQQQQQHISQYKSQFDFVDLFSLFCVCVCMCAIFWWYMVLCIGKSAASTRCWLMLQI